MSSSDALLCIANNNCMLHRKSCLLWCSNLASSLIAGVKGVIVSCSCLTIAHNSLCDVLFVSICDFRKKEEERLQMEEEEQRRHEEEVEEARKQEEERFRLAVEEAERQRKQEEEKQEAERQEVGLFGISVLNRVKCCHNNNNNNNLPLITN